jgi:hypothetical protein
MTKRNIDYDLIINNLQEMINALEYDSMRSSGKAKVNSPQLETLYNMKDRYEAMVSKPSIKPAEVPVPVKKVTKKTATKKQS